MPAKVDRQTYSLRAVIRTLKIGDSDRWQLIHLCADARKKLNMYASYKRIRCRSGRQERYRILITGTRAEIRRGFDEAMKTVKLRAYRFAMDNLIYRKGKRRL